MKSALSRPRPWVVLIFAVAAFSTWRIARLPTAQEVGAPDVAARKWDDSYAKLPMSFEANLGQSGSVAKFISRGRGYTLFLTSNEAVLRLTPPVRRPNGKVPDVREPSETQTRESTVLRMQMRGADAAPQVSGEDALPGKNNYFIGNDPTKWRTNVPTYEKVRYRGVYPGIDMVYYGNGRQLEYDFIVAPGADPGIIQLAFSGSSHMALDPSGDLVLQAGTTAEEIRLHKPVVYQNIEGNKREVPSEYLLDGQNVGFKVGSYDVRQPLVIDPVLSYSTYLGGDSTDQVNGIAVDGSGNAYVAGHTSSLNFPTANPLQAAIGGSQTGTETDAFVAKLNPAGSALLFSTYLGGTANDQALGIAVDNSGNAYVTGFTVSTNFPTVNPLQPANGGSADAFIARLNSAGSVISYSTYLGGTGSDSGQGIVADSSGNAYVAGIAGSSNFPTVNPLQPASGLGQDAFVAKLNSAGSALVYSTYLGGSGGDFASGIAIDSSGNVYLAGETRSSNFPTVNALQPTFGGGVVDAFVAKLNSAGSALLYSTYLGGSGGDQSFGVAADSLGNAYVTGGTSSSNFPTVNAIQPTYGGIPSMPTEAFVAKLNAAGSAFVYSTYLGGNDNETGYGIAADGSGNAYVTGTTVSSNFPIAGFLQPSHAGGGDAFVSQFNPAGSALLFSSYLGSSGSLDRGNAVAVDSLGNVYVAGYTGSNGFPTVNPAQALFGGGSDAFISKIGPASGSLPTATSISQSSAAQGTTLAVTVTGTNFVPGSTWVTIDGSSNGSGVINNGIINVTPTSVTVSFTVLSSAAFGPRNIAVIVPSGTSNPLTFTVTGPFPTLSSINLTSSAQGAIVSVTLTGTFFVAGSTTVNVSGTGVTASAVNVLNANQLTTTLTIAGSASPGARSVTVTTPDGTSNALTFTVIVVVTAPPTLTSINPSSGVQGASLSVTFTGADFAAGSTSVAVSGSGVAAGSAAVSDPTSLTTTFAIATTAALGPRNVTVTTPAGTSNAVTFTVAGDMTPPTISLVVVGGTTASAATISWTTDEASDSQVEYGATTAYGLFTPLNTSLVLSHSVSLGSLAANTTYHFRVRSRDGSGNLATSGDLTFSTSSVADTTPPIISAVSTGSISTSAAAISWTTNEASDSQVEYGTTTAYGQLSPLNTSLVTSHAVSLGSLTINTTYHYRVRSKDGSGNLAVSGDLTFTTSAVADTTPPVISAVSAGSISTSAAAISWTTDEASDSQVEYGPTTAYGQLSPLNTSLVLSHAASLGSLTINTTYHYRVRSKDSSGNLATSGDFTFTTAAVGDTTPPLISDVSAVGISATTAAVSWTTNELANSQAEYGNTTAYGQTTPLNGTLVTSHFFVLTGLVSGSTYHYRVLSADASGNRATSADFLFTMTAASSSSVPFAISNMGGISRTTDGAGSLVNGLGYARIQPGSGNTTPSGLAIFGYRPAGILVSEAGVPDSPLISAGRIYAEVSSDALVNTGLAIANPNATAALISYTIRDTNGTILKSDFTTIGPNQQLARFLNETPYLSGNGIQGTFSFTSSLPVSVIALRGFSNERTPRDFLITTLPVLDLAGGTSSETQVIPHFAAGDGWTTQIVLVNPTSTAQTGTIQFIDQGTASTPGAPKTVTIDGAAGSSTSYLVAANSSKKFLITGASPGTASGSVRVAPLAGGSAPVPLAIFSYKPSSITVSESSVPVRMGTTFRMFAQLSSSPQILTGVAIANATASAGTVTLTLSDLNGVTIATTNPPLTLPASGQIAGFIDQLIPSLAGQTVQGVLRISTDIPNISVAGLRGRYNERLPVSDFLITTTTPTLENGIPNTAERLFPHFANGEGYTTEFILFSGTSGQTSSGSLQFFTQAGGTPTFTVH